MKIGVISDIHIDVNKDYPVLKILADKIISEQLSCLVIAGDISNHYSLTLQFIDEISELTGKPVYFVPGNHDMWDQAAEYKDSRVIYEKYQSHPSCLVNRQIFLDEEWVLSGDTGWYDYSFGNMKFNQADFEKKTMYDRIWQDSVFIDWHENDFDTHHAMLERLEKQLKKSNGKKQIIITHMIGKANFTVPESREKWDYFNAFLGSSDYGNLFERYKVRYSVMGHVHFRNKFEENGVSYICSCLNYHTEWTSADCEAEINDALTIIDLNNNILPYRVVHHSKNNDDKSVSF